MKSLQSIHSFFYFNLFNAYNSIYSRGKILCHPLSFISTRIKLSIQWKEYVWHGFFPYFPIVRVYCRCFLISQIAHNNNYICNCKYLSIRRQSKRKWCTKKKEYFQHITNITHSNIVRFNLTYEMVLFTFLFLFSSIVV